MKQKPKTNTKRFFYSLKRSVLTFNNLVILVAFFIAASWVWGSLGAMQRNFSLQREVDQMHRELELAQLQRDSLELQGRFYKTAEYQELAARESLGLVMPGESLLILPPNSEAAQAADSAYVNDSSGQSSGASVSNFELWINFLFGGNRRSISGE